MIPEGIYRLERSMNYLAYPATCYNYCIQFNYWERKMPAEISSDPKALLGCVLDKKA